MCTGYIYMGFRIAETRRINVDYESNEICGSSGDGLLERFGSEIENVGRVG